MLTKEQKMKMISDAIDAGCKVEIAHYKTTVDKMNALLGLFGGLPVSIKDLHDGSGYAVVNSSAYHDSKDEFEATIFLE